MKTKSKTNFLLKIALCVALALSTFGAVMGFVGNNKLEAQAETVEYQDLLGIENRDWGAASDEYYFGGVTLSPFEWFNSADSVSGCWYNGNDAIIAANEGVDILQYIYINDKSARQAITENNGALLGSSGWLTNPAASPVFVETTNGSGIIIKILRSYVGETYTITFKAGFELTRNDGVRIHVSDDIVYNCVGNVPTKVQKSTVTFNDENGNAYTTKRVVLGSAIGTLPEVPAKSGYVGFWKIDGVAVDENTIISADKIATPVYALEYTDLWGIEDRSSWATDNTNIACFGAVTLDPFGYFITAGGDCWYQGNNALITSNNGVDILKYIEINGENARELLVKNQTEQKVLSGTGSWLSNPAAWPIAMETSGDVWIRIDKSNFGGSFEITFKKGFSLIRNDGQVVLLTDDVTYNYNGSLSKVQKYTVTFEGVETRTIVAGEPIGELPAVPAREGFEGAWAIDGEVITAETIVSANSTAVAVYSKNITETIALGDWGVPETESDIRYLLIRDGASEIAAAYPYAYWNDHADNKNSNYGVDIMEYILIDGESARDIINKNAAGTTSYVATSTFPLNVGGCYAPICIETTRTSATMKVMVAYKTTFNVTFKAGFTLVTANGERLYTTEDVTYKVGASKGDIVKVEGEDAPTIPEGAIDITSTLAMEDRSWGAHSGEVYVGMLNDGSYFNTQVTGTWYAGNDDIIAANNGVDIMQYIFVNGVSARELITANANGNRLSNACSCWLSNPAAYPVYVESTNGSGLIIRIATAHAGSTFTITFNAGFAITDASGNLVALYKDVEFAYNNGAITKTIIGGSDEPDEPDEPVFEEVDVTDTVQIEFAWVREAESKFKIFITPHSSLTANNAWNISDWKSALISANNGVDIMEYIYVNGQNIRELSDDNRENNTYPLGSGTGWFGNSDQCRPVFVETAADGIWVTVLHSFSSTNYTVTLKEGFAILDSTGSVSVIKKDVTFGCDGTTGATIAKKEYTLSFEGYAETISVITGDPIGALPQAPAKDGYDGVWAIDGVRITEDTIYSYNENKTAVAVYSVNITKNIQMENRDWGSHEGEYYLGVLDMRDKNAVEGANGTTYYLNTSSSVSGCWYHGNNDIISANNGVDIMQFIYLNGESARDLITENANGERLANACGCWLSNPAAYPIYVETSESNGLMIRIAKAHVGDYFEITIKSGFSIINSAGDVVYVNEDVTYKLLNLSDGESLSKGEITDEDLATVGGKIVTLKNGDVTYLTKSTAGIILPNIEGSADGLGVEQVLIGWTTDPDNLTNLYPVGYTMSIDSETTLHAVWLGFEMMEGAAVRLGSIENSGIRFSVNLNTNDYGIGVNNGLILETGTILCPTSYLVNGRELTHSSLIGADPNVKYYAERIAEIFTEESGVTTYATAFVNIKAKDFSRQYSARGYLKINFTTGVGYVYTNYDAEENSRSIYEVATKAYNDEENPSYKTHETILNYLNKVLDITWDYSFEKTANAIGAAVINGDVAFDGQQVTIPFNGDIASVLINGSRLVAGSNVNVQLGDLMFSFTVAEFDGDSITFTIGAAVDTQDKESKESLHFVSSDEELDFFLNDFFNRHTGVVEDGERQNVNSTVAGKTAEEFFNAEWVSMTYYWYNGVTGYTDESGNYENRIAGLNEYLASVPVDDYGYVWSSNDRVRDAYSEVSTGEQKMGWPFPNNDTVETAHWEFNGSDSNSWSSNISAKTTGGLFTANVSNQSSNITFTSNSFGNWTSKKVYTFYAPLLEFEVRIGDVTNVEDIYVWYTTKDSTSFSEDKKVSVKTIAFEDYNLGSATGEFNHILYLPMYSQTAWGESTSNYLKQLKIEIALKSGTTMSGNVGLNYVRPTLDTRMSNNNSVFISALRTAYDYTGDIDFLVSQMTRARKAYNFLMQMYDSSRNLKKESYLVGHGGNKEDTNWLGNATNASIANSISQGYWDIMYMPEYDFQSNLYFQKALADMAYLEQVMVNSGNRTISAAAVRVKTAKRGGGTGNSTYASVAGANAQIAAENISGYQGDNLTAIQANVEESTTSGGFWDATDGRFVAGYGYNPDKNANVVYDYGYVAWNLEAIYYGIATDIQAKAIMDWLASESESDLYKYAFAPLSITETGDANALNGEYAAQGNKWVNCQFGGAILYTSFYDLMARLEVNGSDDAFDRLKAIQDWYKEVYDYYVENGSDPYDFYRYYYDNKGIQLQGMGTSGALGLDREFLESSLPLASVAYGFFGIDSVDGKALEIAPKLPSELSYWKMENLAFNYYKYDLKIYANAIQLSNVEALKAGISTEGLTIKVVLDYEDGKSVYVNGVKVENPEIVVDGEVKKVTVTVDFGATVVEVR